MKRKLALFMVLALLISLVPMNVFAATDNSVNKVPTVSDDTEFTSADAPKLRIEESNDGEFGTTSQTFVLKLENAEWDTADAATIGAVTPVGLSDITATYLSATRMEVTLIPDGTLTDSGYVLIPLVAELQGEGAAKVTIESKNSSVSAGTYTFANGSGGNTDASIDDETTFRDTATMESIVIEELVAGTIESGDEVNLKITNSDFEFVNPSAAIALSGAFAGWTASAITYDDNVLTFTMTETVAGAGLGTITISGIQIDPQSDANFGDVNIKVYGDNITDETLLVGKYVDYTVVAEADDEDLPTIYAGDLADGYLTTDVDGYTTGADTDVDLDDAGLDVDDIDTVDGEENEIMQLNIYEDVSKSWVIGRETKVEFPEYIKIIDFDVVDSDNISVDGTTLASDADVENALESSFEIGDSELSFDSLYADDITSTMEIDLQFYVSVEADAAAGDIVATVSGKAIGEEFKVKLGKIEAPVKATVEVKDVKIGVQDQMGGKITITEAADGVLEGDLEVVVSLDDEDGLSWSATPDFKVTKGDLEIDEVEKSGLAITTTVDQDSSEASTFELTGFEVDVNRSVPEGDFNVTIGGNAIVKNYEDDGDYYFFDTDSVVDTKYVRVITPAPGDTTAGEKVVFTIGSADYMVGAVKMTSDAAPYINEQGRTMLPLRALANALGVADSNIMWNEVERSVTIFKGDATIKVVIGQMSFVKNGVAVPMDTMAVINNGRTMLPLRAIGQALGAEILWDEATRTVTVQ